jgi:hypothetical protein
LFDSKEQAVLFAEDCELKKNTEGALWTSEGIATNGSEIVTWTCMTNQGYLSWTNAPAATNSTGTAGQLAYSNNYFYVCVSNNTWRRTTLATW